MCTYCTVVRPVSCRRIWYAKPVEVTVVFIFPRSVFFPRLGPPQR